MSKTPIIDIPTKVKDVILDIAGTNVSRILMEGSLHDCYEIVEWQVDLIELYKGRKKCIIDDEYQLPEPFSGKIDKADYLILSSNPAFSFCENFPVVKKYKSKPDDVIDFFYNRLNNYSNPSYLTKASKICKWVSELDQGIIKTPIDYPIDEEYIKITDTEKSEFINKDKIVLVDSVPFKSNGEYGVPNAIKFCLENYLSQRLDLFEGKYIIICGDYAERVLNHIKSSSTRSKIISKGINKVFIVPHPCAWGTDIDKINKIEQRKI